MQGQAVLDWLTFLTVNNPHYSDSTIDAKALGVLPVDSSVESLINIVNKIALTNVAETSKSTVGTSDSQQQNRPEQGGAMGENDPDQHC
eukprot:3929498-Ditylum_brightwellii.AAC.1